MFVLQMVNVIGQPVNCDIACEEILKFIYTQTTGRLPEYVMTEFSSLRCTYKNSVL